MKKIILILFILLAFNLNVEATTTSQEVLNAIENNLFGYDYKSESDSKRIERIEKQLYGEKKVGSEKIRLKKIQEDTGFSLNKQPSNTNTISEQIQQKIKEDSTVQYPMVDKLEEEVFHTTYKNEDIYKRLDRLEMQIFNSTTNDNLNNRVDKLSAVIKPKKRINRTEQLYNSNSLDNYYRNNGLEPVNNESIPFQLATLEQKILKNDYMNDNISNRLARLEQKLFSRTFTNDSDVSRIQRIMVAYDAKQDSYKYENNRKMQKMAAASQWGGILLMILAMLL